MAQLFSIFTMIERLWILISINITLGGLTLGGISGIPLQVFMVRNFPNIIMYGLQTMHGMYNLLPIVPAQHSWMDSPIRKTLIITVSIIMEPS